MSKNTKVDSLKIGLHKNRWIWAQMTLSEAIAKAFCQLKKSDKVRDKIDTGGD